MKLRHASKRINKESRFFLRKYKLKKSPYNFMNWVDCQIYAPSFRRITRLLDTKYYETKINQRRKRIPSDFCDPKQNFYNKTMKRLGWDK